MRRATDGLSFAFVIATWLAAPHVARAQTLTVFSSAYFGSNSTTSVMIGAEVNGLAPAAVRLRGDASGRTGKASRRDEPSDRR